MPLLLLQLCSIPQLFFRCLSLRKMFSHVEHFDMINIRILIVLTHTISNTFTSFVHLGQHAHYPFKAQAISQVWLVFNRDVSYTVCPISRLSGSNFIEKNMFSWTLDQSPNRFYQSPIQCASPWKLCIFSRSLMPYVA